MNKETFEKRTPVESKCTEVHKPLTDAERGHIKNLLHGLSYQELEEVARNLPPQICLKRIDEILSAQAAALESISLSITSYVCGGNQDEVNNESKKFSYIK